MKEKILDVGCGFDKIPGSTGIDIADLKEVDIVHDLNITPWPIEDNTFDRVICKHSLSHLNSLISSLEEIHRVLKPGGIVEILAPHYSSDNFNTDPTHKFHMGIRSMNYFCEQYAFKFQYYSDIRFEMIKRNISFRENLTDFRKSVKFNPFRTIGVEWIVNRIPRLYERFFVYMLPASEIYFKMRVIK